MKLGAVIQRVRKQQGLSQARLAARIPCSPSLVSLIESGKVQPSDEVLQGICRVLPAAGILREAARRASLGALVGPELDGVLDQHRCALVAELHRQIDEALAALDRVGALIVRRPETLDVAARNEVALALQEIVDAERYAEATIARLCEEYELDLVRVYRENDTRLYAAGVARRESGGAAA